MGGGGMDGEERCLAAHTGTFPECKNMCFKGKTCSTTPAAFHRDCMMCCCVYTYGRSSATRTCGQGQSPFATTLEPPRTRSGRALGGCPCRWPNLRKPDMGAAKDRKGCCRAAPPTRAEPDKKKEHSSAAVQGQKRPSRPFCVRSPWGLPTAWLRGRSRKNKRVRLDAGGRAHKDKTHPC